MRTRYLVIVAVVLLPLASVRSDDPTPKTVEKTYILSKPQGEALALLFRLDMPRDTEVVARTPPGTKYSEVTITGPQKVHDAVAPLIDLLNTERGALHKEEVERQQKLVEKTNALQRKEEQKERQKRKPNLRDRIP